MSFDLPQPIQSLAQQHAPHSAATRPSQSLHPMVTRAREGIFKPKALTTMVELLTVKDAQVDPNWSKALNEEY